MQEAAQGEPGRPAARSGSPAGGAAARRQARGTGGGGHTGGREVLVARLFLPYKHGARPPEDRKSVV